MDRLSNLIENSRQAIRNWWLLLLVGVLLIVAGIMMFFYPEASYMTLALIFGWVMLVAGVFEVALAATSKHYVTGRGWMLAGGIIEILLGLILIFNVGVSAAVLPIFLGFWLLIRSFYTIGWGSDMSAMQIEGSGWTIFAGILLLLCSMWILFEPLVFGTAAVLVWVAISLILAGVGSCTVSLQLRTAHKYLKN